MRSVLLLTVKALIMNTFLIAGGALLAVTLVVPSLRAAVLSVLWPGPTRTAITSSPSITKLKSIGQLTTLTVHIADVLQAEDPSWFGYKAAWIVKGDAQLSVDLEHAEITELPWATRRPRWQITLPAPQVISARVDHDETRIFDMRRKIWVPWPSDRPQKMLDEAMRHAQQLVRQKADDPRHHSLARKQAEIVLESFCRQLNVDVEIVWREADGVPTPERVTTPEPVPALATVP
jgi:hypothetical protein